MTANIAAIIATAKTNERERITKLLEEALTQYPLGSSHRPGIFIAIQLIKQKDTNDPATT